MGGALNEAYVFNDRGQRAHPTSLDLSMLDTVRGEVANPGHP